MRYLLLPFTHGIDGQAITYALSLASQHEAVLVLLALLRSGRRRGKPAVRPEEIQQATDFLVYTQQRAARMGVPIHQAQIHTAHPVQSIRAFGWEMNCQLPPSVKPDTYTQIKTFEREERESPKEKGQWTSVNQKTWSNGQWKHSARWNAEIQDAQIV